jgi:hypothetical protein
MPQVASRSLAGMAGAHSGRRDGQAAGPTGACSIRILDASTPAHASRAPGVTHACAELGWVQGCCTPPPAGGVGAPPWGGPGWVGVGGWGSNKRPTSAHWSGSAAASSQWQRGPATTTQTAPTTPVCNHTLVSQSAARAQAACWAPAGRLAGWLAARMRCGRPHHASARVAPRPLGALPNAMTGVSWSSSSPGPTGPLRAPRCGGESTLCVLWWPPPTSMDTSATAAELLPLRGEPPPSLYPLYSETCRCGRGVVWCGVVWAPSGPWRGELHALDAVAPLEGEAMQPPLRLSALEAAPSQAAQAASPRLRVQPRPRPRAFRRGHGSGGCSCCRLAWPACAPPLATLIW